MGGAQVFSRGNSARAVLQCLKKNEIVALLPDQNAGDVFVPFLGVTTGTVDGPAIIHRKTQAPLLFSWCIRMPDDRFRIIFEPPVIIEPTEDRDSDIHAIMTCINGHLETKVRQFPTQWLWLHNRWKSTPQVYLASSGPDPAGELPVNNSVNNIDHNRDLRNDASSSNQGDDTVT